MGFKPRGAAPGKELGPRAANRGLGVVHTLISLDGVHIALFGHFSVRVATATR